MSLTDSDRDLLLSLVHGAPGPAPWYVRGQEPGVTCRGRPPAWVEADPEGPFHGDMVLDDDGKSLLFVRMYTIVGPVGENRLLVAFKRRQPDVLHLHLFHADDLQPIDDPRMVGQVIENPDQPYWAAGEPEAQVVISRRLAPGVHPFHFPAPFSTVGETVLVTHLVRPGAPANETRSTALVVLQPEARRLEVIPQTWFNEGDYQHGYQWITRAARDPLSERIVGEGMRLGYFLLNETGDQVEEWLLEDRAHLPSDKGPRPTRLL